MIGEDIPLESRIIRISDVFDALTSDRPYRKALSNQQAYEFIKEHSNKLFDPKLVDIFSKLFPDIVKYKDQDLHV